MIPALALAAFGAMTLLWVSGRHAAYFGLLDFVGIRPFRFPFVDTHGVLAAAECARRGIDVYLSNPCDVLGRVHDYSPLWLVITPSFLDAADTPWVGAGLDVLFILSLGVALHPQSAVDAAIMTLAVFSPMTIYALERGNNDIVIFLVLLWTSLFFTGSRAARHVFYAGVLVAALLKYYPAVALILLAREPRRNFIFPAMVAVIVLAIFITGYHREILLTIANIPPGPYATNAFSAENLPFGLTKIVAGPHRPLILPVMLLAILTVLAIVRAHRNYQFLQRAAISWDGGDGGRLAIGSVLLTACFFAASNVDYRGIYFLLVIPGLLSLRRAATSTEMKRWLAWLSAAVLYVMWSEFFRVHLDAAFAGVSAQWLYSRIRALLWLSREIAWWWLISAMAGIVMAYLRQLPLVREGVAGLASLRLGRHTEPP